MISSPRFITLVLAATLILSGTSCEQHSWDETKKLHHLGDEHAEEGHGSGGDADDDSETEESDRAAESQ